MTITSLQGVRDGIDYERYVGKTVPSSGTYPRLSSLWAQSGVPGAGGYDTTLNGVTLSSSTTGSLPIPAASGLNTHIALMSVMGSSATLTMLICDRLWHNGGITITSTGSQSITSPTWPARDNNESTDGEGVLLALEVSVSTGAGTPTITVGYTNSAGTGSRTATNIAATVATSSTSNAYLIGLQDGDRGVRSVQSIQLSATWTSGTINLVAYRPLCMFRLYSGALQVSRAYADVLSLGMPRVYDNSCLYFMVPASGGTTMSGIYSTTAG